MPRLEAARLMAVRSPRALCPSISGTRTGRPVSISARRAASNHFDRESGIMISFPQRDPNVELAQDGPLLDDFDTLEARLDTRVAALEAEFTP
jgi:hypothetical protein